MTFDYFLNIEGLEGECVHENHRGETDLMSFAWGEQQAPGKVELREIEFTDRVSKISPRLLVACAAGEHFQKAEVLCAAQMRESPVVFKLIFSMVVVASYEIIGQEAGHPLERVRLSYGKVECEYREILADGTFAGPISSGFDAVSNQVVPLCGPLPATKPRRFTKSRR